jgi:hypothetical protein
MRSILVVVAFVLALLAAGVLFTTDSIRQSLFGPSAEDLLANMNEVAISGGYAATFADSGATSWQLAAGHKLERFSLDGKGAVFARLTSSVPLDTNSLDWPQLGLTWKATREFNNRMNGKRVEIGIVARRAATNAADSVMVLYATQQMGNSTWRRLYLSESFELRTFTFDMPKIEPGGYVNPPIVVIHSDPLGSGKSVEILGVYLKPAPQADKIS